MKIVVDDRELKSMKELLKNAQDKYTNVVFEVKRLYIGDFLLYNDNDEIIAAFERKTWNDLASSISDGRTSNVDKLLQLRPAKLFYIMEGKPILKRTKLPIELLKSHLNSLIFNHDIHVLYSAGCSGTIEQLAFMANFLKHRRFSPWEQETLECLIQYKKFGAEHFYRYSSESPSALFMEYISKKYFAFHNIPPSKISDGQILIIDDCEDYSSVEFPSHIFIIHYGEKNNLEHISKQWNVMEKKQVDPEECKQKSETPFEVHCRMLQCAKGMSESLSKRFIENKWKLEHFTKVDCHHLSEQCYPSGRKIGEKSALKLLKHFQDPQNFKQWLQCIVGIGPKKAAQLMGILTENQLFGKKENCPKEYWHIWDCFNPF